MAAIPFQPMMESRPIREIAYEVLKHAIITGKFPLASASSRQNTPTACTSAARRCVKPCGSWSATGWWSMYSGAA